MHLWSKQGFLDNGDPSLAAGGIWMWDDSRVECSDTYVNGGESFAVLSKSVHPPNFQVGSLNVDHCAQTSPLVLMNLSSTSEPASNRIFAHLVPTYFECKGTQSSLRAQGCSVIT